MISRSRLLVALALTIGVVGYFLWYAGVGASNETLEIARSYLRATYARDGKAIYSLLSNADRTTREEATFLKSQSSFDGFTLEVARKLAGFMEVRPLSQNDGQDQRTIKLSYRAPAPAELNGLLLDWDQDKLNALPAGRQKEIFNRIDSLQRSHKLVMIDGQEELELVRENGAWKVFLNWASGIKVKLGVDLVGTPIEIKFAQNELFTKDDELFLVSLTIKNSSPQPVTFSVSHQVDPGNVGDYLELVECGLLTPVTLGGGQSREYSMAYLLAGGARQNLREFTLTYRFKKS